MKRAFVGAVSSLVWPGLVLVIPAGITFFAPRLYAESAPAPPTPCDASVFTACRDASPNDYCSDPSCSPGKCGCVVRQSCDSYTAEPVLVCRGTATCEDFVAENPTCVGKAEGSPCASRYLPRGGECVPTPCFAPGDGGFVQQRFMSCVGRASAAEDAATDAPSVRGPDDAGVDGSSGSAGSNGAAPAGGGSGETSGCDASRGSASGAAALLGAPLAIGLLLARRRRRRR